MGVLGNWDCESNCEPNRLQGDFDSQRRASKNYVEGVTNGSISRNSFGYDSKGFGLYQLTYFSRKLGYYDYWKKSGKPLDDAVLQTDYAIVEMKTDYSGLLSFLKQTDNVYEAASRVCKEFERPAVNNIDARANSANRIKGMIDLNNWNGGTEEPQESESKEVESWPPRTIDGHCNGWPEVWLLQSILKVRGFWEIDPDGQYGRYLREAVRAFQKANGLADDGVCGKNTWKALGMDKSVF